MRVRLCDKSLLKSEWDRGTICELERIDLASGKKRLKRREEKRKEKRKSE